MVVLVLQNNRHMGNKTAMALKLFSSAMAFLLAWSVSASNVKDNLLLLDCDLPDGTEASGENSVTKVLFPRYIPQSLIQVYYFGVVTPETFIYDSAELDKDGVLSVYARIIVAKQGAVWVEEIQMIVDPDGSAKFYRQRNHPIDMQCRVILKGR
ncbi:MAG: hypothetical protein H6624_16020 [Bdellovibrionaceae bacterium]|nr:hypothetical protein [Bdellovibrionales bacterium]MCB9085855.1 hypothetical protein [Pseudobdellovibrionaceae bacterium]